MSSTQVAYDIIARDRASKAFRNVANSASQTLTRTQKVANGMKKVGHVAGLGLAVMGAAAVKLGKDSVKAASDAQQSIGGTQAVFGKHAGQVIKMSNAAAKAYGLSANSYRESANILGSLLKNQGVQQDKLAGSTKKLIGFGADLSATYGGTVKDSVEALSAAFKGEYDPLEKYGISLKQSTVNAAALSVAHVKTTTAFNKLSTAQQTAAKRQATINLLYKQGAPALGQFQKQSGTLAEQQQILGARFENLEVKIGNKLLPMVSKLVTFGGKAITWAQHNGTAVKVLGGAVVGLTATLWAAGKAVQAWSTVTKVAAAAQKVFNLVLKNNPIGIVITVLAALTAAVIYAYKHSKTFRKICQDAFHAVAAAGKWMWNNVLQPVFKFLVDAIAFVMKMWAKMLGALGHVPGFGWAKTASKVMYDAAEKANHLGDQIKKIPNHANVTIVDNTAAKIAATQSYIDKLQRLNGSVARTYIEQIVHKGPVAGGGHPIPPRAMGGPVWRGRPYLVGERGPEIFWPTRTGRIIPNRDVRRAATGAEGKQQTVNVNVTGYDLSDPSRTGREIARQLRFAGVGG